MHFGLIDLETLPDHLKVVLVDWGLDVEFLSEALVIVAINGCLMGLYDYYDVVVHIETSFDKINLAFLLQLFRRLEDQGGVVVVEKMLLDPRENLFRRNDGLGADCCALAAEADVSVTNHFVNWVVCGVLTHSFAVVYVLAHIDAIKTDFRSELEHVTEVFELLQVSAFR